MDPRRAWLPKAARLSETANMASGKSHEATISPIGALKGTKNDSLDLFVKKSAYVAATLTSAGQQTGQFVISNKAKCRGTYRLY